MMRFLGKLKKLREELDSIILIESSGEDVYKAFSKLITKYPRLQENLVYQCAKKIMWTEKIIPSYNVKYINNLIEHNSNSKENIIEFLNEKDTDKKIVFYIKSILNKINEENSLLNGYENIPLEIFLYKYITLLSDEVNFLKKLTKLVVKIEMQHAHIISSLPFLTHMTSKSNFYKIFDSGEILSEYTLSKTIPKEDISGYTMEFDKFVGLNRFVFFGINWGVSDHDKFSFVFNADYFLNLNIEINFVKVDLIAYRNLFILLFLLDSIKNPTRTQFINNIGGIEEVNKFIKKHSSMPFSEENMWVQEPEYENIKEFYELTIDPNFNKICNAFFGNFDSLIPEKEKVNFIYKFKSEHVDKMTLKNKRIIMEEIIKNSKKIKFNRFFGTLLFGYKQPEIRAYSPFKIFNPSLMGFFVPEDEIQTFLDHTQSKYGNSLNNYNLYTSINDKIVYEKIGEWEKSEKMAV